MAVKTSRLSGDQRLTEKLVLVAIHVKNVAMPDVSAGMLICLQLCRLFVWQVHCCQELVG